jgi:hypothetical protein
VQSDWPLPTTKLQGKTWTWTQQIPSVFPFIQSDWPLPTQISYSAKTQGWTWQQQLDQPQLFGTAWPAVAPKPYRVVDVGQNLLALYQVVTPAPFAQSDWPTPRWSKFQGVPDVSGLLPSAGIQPFTPQDWPLPQKIYFVQGEVSGRALGSGAKPFTQGDWQLPTAKAYRVVDVGQNLLALYQVTGAPFTQSDWPTPRTTKQAPQDIPQNYLVGLAPQGLAPFTPQDWPLPRKSPFFLGATSGRAIASSLAPFTQLDWPSPKFVKFSNSWTWTTLLPPQVQIALPFAQADWPLPQKIYFVQGEVSGRAIASAVAPFSQKVWPLPGTIPFAIPAWYTLRYEPVPIVPVPPTITPPSTIGGIGYWTTQFPRPPEKPVAIIFKRNMENADRQDLEDIAKILKALEGHDESG